MTGLNLCPLPCQRVETGRGDLRPVGSISAEMGRWWPGVTVVVRCDPVDCGPGVAPMWPQRS